MAMDAARSMDVSWLHHAKEHHGPTRAPNPESPVPNGDTPSTKSATSTVVASGSPPPGKGAKLSPQTTKETGSKPIPVPARPGAQRTNSAEKTTTNAPKGSPSSPGTQRRGSWLSSLSSKFSSQGQTPTTNGKPLPVGPEEESDDAPRPPPSTSPKNAILPHANRVDGDAPYVPAPPRSSHPSFFASALRRLSSSGGQLQGHVRAQHGLCDRRVLNIDKNRDRCCVVELDQSKLRRVSFCVDVEIAPAPQYSDDDVTTCKKDQIKKKKMTEKGEGEALKHPDTVKAEKEVDGVIKATGETLPKEPEKEGSDPANAESGEKEKETTRKKEKKKKSEEERKARKEKRRRQAEANGSIPIEHTVDTSDSSEDKAPATTDTTTTPKPRAVPTIDPVRVYRRCCQLRETPILKRITEQLSNPSNSIPGKPGYVAKLDLTDYAMNLSDLSTLGDYLAVVPITEIILENCNLTDEGLRIILAGLLDSKPPHSHRRRRKPAPPELQGGVVERLVLKNNPKIGRDGWRYICTFLNLSRSLRLIDLSMIPFPQPLTPTNSNSELQRRDSNASSTKPELHCTFSKAISERLAGSTLELINLAETGLTTEQLGVILDGAIKLGLRRLGLAGNNLTADGLEHVARYLRSGKCEGLDLGSNDLKDQLNVIADVLSENEDHPIWALCLAGCDLTPDSLWTLFPALVKLKNLRFLDLSHNHGIFSIHPSALSLLRRYLPKMPILRRIHLTDVAMEPEQAIALAEVLPECPQLAHINLMENPELTKLATNTDEAVQEEACAFYASLMAAVRVSSSIVCIDVDVPREGTSDVVKALAKQVIAYCLRNMESGPVAEFDATALASTEAVPVPEVLLHLVGHIDGIPENHDNDEPAPNEDYVIGSQGLVKALDICLNRRNTDLSRQQPPTCKTSAHLARDEVTPELDGKAKTMSKNLLDSARKIRLRLQPALAKEAQGTDAYNYNRLLFLDQTLERIIQRFEEEFPETRVSGLPSEPSQVSVSPTASIDGANGCDAPDIECAAVDANNSDEDDGILPKLSRHNSDVSIASRALAEEEGRMHRFGQQFRRDILKPDTEDQLHGTTGREHEPAHLQMLRAMVDELGGDEIKRKIVEGGHSTVIKELSDQASALRQQLIEKDPEAWERFEQSQDAAERNLEMTGSSRVFTVQ